MRERKSKTAAGVVEVCLSSFFFFSFIFFFLFSSRFPLFFCHLTQSEEKKLFWFDFTKKFNNFEHSRWNDPILARVNPILAELGRNDWNRSELRPKIQGPIPIRSSQILEYFVRPERSEADNYGSDRYFSPIF